MSIEAMTQALVALEKGESALRWEAITALSQAIAKAKQAQPVANGKLKVTLQDTPTEIELTQYKRMFEAACSALGVIGEALGVDEDEGGAEPILAAIAELKASPCPTCKALARTVMMDQTAHDTAPPQRQPLTDEEMYLAIRPLYRTDALTRMALNIAADEYRAIEAAHGIKEKT